MIAYKIFSRLPNGKLGPITIDNLEYDPKYIMTVQTVMVLLPVLKI